MEAVEELVEVEWSTEAAEAERLAEVEGFAEVEGVAEEGLVEDGLAEVEAELQDKSNCLLEDIIDRLSSVASQLRVPQDSETLFSLVSSGTIGLEHSHGLKIHNFTGSWSQYYPVLSS